MTSFLDLIVVFWITILKQTGLEIYMNHVLDSDNSFEGAIEISKSFISVWSPLCVVLILLLVFNATFNNIAIISWRSVSLDD